MGFPGTFARLKPRLSYMAGNQVAYGANKFESGLSAVSLLTPLWAPGADSGQRGKNEIRGKIRTEK